MCKRFFSTVAVVLISTFISTALTGCYDAAEIDDEIYALALGVDKGTHNKVRITVQYPNYKSGGGGSGQQGGNGKGGEGSSNQIEGTNVHTVEAPTILEALDLYGTALSRRLSFMHTKLLVFSEAFAREGVGEYLGPMARYRETRRTMGIVIVKGTAEDFIKENKTNIGESLSKTIELMSMQADNSGMFPKTNFHEFYRGVVSTFEQGYATYAGINDFNILTDDFPETTIPLKAEVGYLPGEVPRRGVAKREFVGTAIFNGDKMVGSLNSNETKYFLMIIGKFKRGFITLEDKKAPDMAIPLDVRPGRAPVLKGRLENGVPVIDVKLTMEADIGAIQSRINYEQLDLLHELCVQGAEQIKMNVINLINKVQNEYKADIFGFGHKISGYFPTIQKWDEYNWLEKFEEARINVSVDLNIRRTGLMVNSSPITVKE